MRIGILQLPSAISAFGDNSGACCVTGNFSLPGRRASRISLSRKSKFLKVNLNYNFGLQDLLKYGAHKGHYQAVSNKSIKYKHFRIQRRCVGICCVRFEPAKISSAYYNDRRWDCVSGPRRSVAARSDLVKSGTPNAVPVPEFRLGPKVRGVCFYAVTAVVAIFLFVLMLVGHPFVLLFDWYRRKFHHLIARIWATLTIAPFFKIEFEGLEHLPRPDMPAVYVSNHQSFLDIYTLLTLRRDFKFISKTGIFVYPIIGWAMFLLGVIPLKRMDSRSQLECLKQCMDLIKGGASVFFFPEGTRSKDGTLGSFKKGAFSVAAKTGVPVVPMTIMGTGNIMPAGREGLLNPGSVRVIIHPTLVGNNAEALCREARDVIANTLNRQG